MPTFPQVGAYTIDAELGRGAMGIVYRARDPHLARPVAIKALPPELAADPTRLACFEREARLMAGLSHPNIATVYGLEHSGTSRFLVMELVDGDTLASRLSRGRLALDEALGVCAQIAAGVEAAHDRGVVHRDLKPGNVMLQQDGTAKVLDFGLAREGATRTFKSRLSSVASDPDPHATEEGLAVGTPGYMSPEQARGREVDRRTDIFAFGCVLFECLTGRAVFHGDTPVDAITATLEREPDWSLLPDRTPPRVRDLLASCLAKDPKHRLRDIGDARIELERSIERREWTSTGAMRAAPAGRQSLRGALPWTVAVLALAAAATAFLEPWRARPTGVARPLPLRFVVNEPEIRARHVFDLASLAISPDGTTVCYGGPGREDSNLYVRRLSEARSTPLSILDDNEGHNPAFSPDGRWIAFQRARQLLKVPVGGGQAVELYSGPGLTKGHCWTERGIIVSAKVSGGLSLLAPNGGALTTLTTPDASRGEVSHRWPDALPDGRHVLFTIKKADMTTFDDADIALLDMDRGTWRTLVKGGMYARYVSTGHIVYGRAGNLLAVPFDARTGELAGTSIVVVEGVATEPGSGAAQFAVARDTGTLVYVPGGADEPKAEMVWLDLDGTSKPVGAPLRNYSWGEISPDGTRLAIGVYGASDVVYVYDFARGTSTRLTSKGNSTSPFWSLDGKRVAFLSDREGEMALFTTNADGTGEPERIEDGSFLPSSTFVRFEGAESVCFEKDRDVWVHPHGASSPARPLFQTPFHEQLPRVSPDQRWIAYTSDESGQEEFYVRPFPTGEGKWQVSIGGCRDAPWWLPGSDGIVYAGKDGIYVTRAPLADFAHARPERLMPDPGPLMSLMMMPDGKRFIGIRAVPPTAASGKVEAVLNWFTELEAKVPGGRR